ncbi:MAG TPA: hypothetical protein VIT23_13100 [Terrimicrobiaceae bacterium]
MLLPSRLAGVLLQTFRFLLPPQSLVVFENFISHRSRLLPYDIVVIADSPSVACLAPANLIAADISIFLLRPE